MFIVKQNTATNLTLGPLVDATDGATLETSVSFGSNDLALVKADGTFVNISSNTVSSHLGAGLYNLSLNAGDLDQLGKALVVAYDAAHRPLSVELMVLPANTYDALVSGTDYLQTDILQINGNAIAAFLSGTTGLNADVTKINGNAASGFLTGTDKLRADTVMVSGSATAADNQEAALLGIVPSAVNDVAATTTSFVTDLTEATNDHYNGRTLVFTSGAVAGQVGSVEDYNGATKAITLSAALTEAPADNVTFVLV